MLTSARFLSRFLLSVSQRHLAIDAAFGQKHLSPAVYRQAPDVVLSSGSGCWVHGTNGEKLLDFTSGIGVLNTGHCHPRVVRAAQQQVARLVHAQCTITHQQPVLELLERLIRVTPTGMDNFHFYNSGAEAVEGAVKFARLATGRPNIVTLEGGFHGRTLAAASMTTTKSVYRDGMGPMPAGFYVSPFLSLKGLPDWNEQAIGQLNKLFKTQTAASQTAAIVVEPILGEGGYIVPPDDFLPQVRKFCDANGILLVADEVQTGFGRTGKFFAIEHWNVRPDVIIMAKGLGSGFPISATVSSRELADKQPLGSAGGTYAGNCVACAAASATIDVIEQEALLENANERGKQLVDGLKLLAAKRPIKEIRGKGLMIGVEFNAPYGTANSLVKHCKDEGMLILTAGNYETIRFIPPLIANKKEIDTGLEIFDRALNKQFGH